MPRPIGIKVLSDFLPLEGVPTGVTRVANICVLKKHLYFLQVLLPNRGFMPIMTDLCRLKMS
jgi:hypothetical protein